MQLYDYQLDMLHRIEAAFGSHQSVMVQMPTGTGKTLVLASVVKSEERRVKKRSSQAEGKSNPCVWIVAHRRELVEQIESTLKQLMEQTDLFSLRPVNSTSSPPTLRSSLKVMSIQWLSRHYKELDEQPTLIVIDEAHHAVAKTYADVMNAYPNAKKLGVTATPCRLRKRGFTDLFDVLLMSWTTKRFIATGRLSLYDYMSIKADSEDQRTVFGLAQRGADGDFSQKEMSEKLDVRPSIERLCDTVLRYAADKKGITYAIDIAHAEHIAEEYRRHGIRAVAISSKTPAAERKKIIERFKGSVLRRPETSATIQVLVNVDLFGEGFDCPDVEFIQLARPTLSLAKYLQQVGRGMRVFEGKKYCLILDNVGLYRLFGLPSDDRDWMSMFEGKAAGKGNIAQAEEQYNVAYSIRDDSQAITTADKHTELITVMTHEGQRMDLEAAYGYDVAENGDGLFGITDKEGNDILPCIYNKVELKAYGFAQLHSRRKIDREKPWIDLRNGVRFRKRPRTERHGFLEFSTTDGIRLYPRVLTRLMDENCCVLANDLKYGIEGGLRFKTFFIQPSEPDKLYSCKDKIDDVELWEDGQGRLAWRKGWDASLHPTTAEEWADRKTAWEEETERFKEEEKQYIRNFTPEIRIGNICGKPHLADYEEPQYLRISSITKNSCQVYYRKHWLDKWESAGTYTKIFPAAYGIRVVQNRDWKYLVRTDLFKPLETPEQEYEYAELQDNALLHFTEEGEEYWVYLENKACFTKKPEFVTIGFMDFIKIGDVYMERCPHSRQTYRRAEIRMYDNVCFLGNKNVIVNSEYNCRHFSVQHRHLDGKRFVLTETFNPNSSIYDMYYDGKNPPTINRRKRDYEIKDLRR